MDDVLSRVELMLRGTIVNDGAPKILLCMELASDCKFGLFLLDIYRVKLMTYGVSVILFSFLFVESFF